jgi:hypothetical protein
MGETCIVLWGLRPLGVRIERQGKGRWDPLYLVQVAIEPYGLPRTGILRDSLTGCLMGHYFELR